MKRTTTQTRKFIALRTWGLPLLAAVALNMTACGAQKEGCPINDRAAVKTNRKGEMSTKRGKSNLFPKKMRKRM